MEKKKRRGQRQLLKQDKNRAGEGERARATTNAAWLAYVIDHNIRRGRLLTAYITMTYCIKDFCHFLSVQEWQGGLAGGEGEGQWLVHQHHRGQ